MNTSFVSVWCLFILHIRGMTAVKDRAYFRSIPRVNFSRADAVKEDVVYKLFRDNSTEVGRVLTAANVAEGDFDEDLYTALIVHGWTTDDTSPWYKPLKDAYFKLGGYNVVYVDWSKAGNKSYMVSTANIEPVGRFIAEFLVAAKVPPKKIHIIGHSLGAQLAGSIGRATLRLTGDRIGRITGLDPAGPAFENPQMRQEERLSSLDAYFVDVIHTDIQYSGFTAPMGHVDFYPNGGRNQPGCPDRAKDDNCSHARSTVFFIESLGIKTAAKESTYEESNYEVSITPKKDGKDIIFGQHVDLSARGVYYFQTNSERPFLKS